MVSRPMGGGDPAGGEREAAIHGKESVGTSTVAPNHAVSHICSIIEVFRSTLIGSVYVRPVPSVHRCFVGAEEQAKIRQKDMQSGNPFFRKTPNYRVLIDSEGIGHIRIIKRVNFRTVLAIFRDLYLELKKKTARPHIIVYVSPSLSSEMSENMRDFLDFAAACMEGRFELTILE